MKPVAICISLLERHRKVESTIEGWEQWLDRHGIPWEYLDCYRYDIIEHLPKYSALLWHYGNYVNADLMEAQHILDLAENMGLKVYPNHHTGWHFDDKIAEMYAFQAIHAPIPESWVYYELDKCISWLETDAIYPLVAKLRRGSGSNNVKLLHDVPEAKRYARKMFGHGYSPAQSLVYKSYSKIQSTRNWKTFAKRLKQVPNFLWSRRFGKGMPAEKGYCYFQEYIENDGFDIKVAVVNGKCSYLVRSTRKADFRASGGGSIYYQRDVMKEHIIRSAFDAASALKMQCVGFDYVVDKSTGEGKIIEMCHGFDADAIYQCGGYWDDSLQWHNEPLNAKVEILDYLFSADDRIA